MWRTLGAQLLEGNGLDTLCDAIVVELEMVRPGSFGEGGHGVIGGTEGRVYWIVTGREVALGGGGGGQEVQLVIVGVEGEVVRHGGCGIGDVVDHGDGRRRQ